MAIIKKLDDTLSNLIAAGEVVERPASVVKELVENSLDANATYIEVNLIDSGIKMIEVIDNGDGMDPEDAKMAFQRHATSKISNMHDLSRIQTLGFRGEAIPSIASVSQMTLITNDGKKGYKVTYRGGKFQKEGNYACNKGTQIIVENLFFNTPARLKYIKSLNVELGVVTEYMDKLALSHPSVRFKLSNNKKVLMETNGYNDMVSLIGKVYGLEVAKNIFTYESSQNGTKLKAYLIAPFINRSKKSYITMIVNGRMVKNSRVINSVIDGYSTYLPTGRFPISIVFLDVDPMLIDVNVHPAKMEIKFSNEDEICKFIIESIHKSFEKEINFIAEVKEELPKEEYKAEDLFQISSFDEEIKPYTFKEQMEGLVEENKIDFSEPAVTLPKPKLPFLEYIGQFSGTYLLCQNAEGLFVIDQHAAAERIRYEYYYEKLGNVDNTSQQLLIPINMELTKKDFLFLKDHLELLKSIGFDVDVLNESSIDVRSVPIWVEQNLIIEITEKIINFIIENGVADISKVRDSLAKSISCKGAIKANHAINRDEVSVLLDNLSKCNNPYTCPHGRPTIIKFTNYEIEKMFKRIM